MTEDHREVRVPDHVLVRAVDEELVLLNLDNEQYYGLDEVGAAMWGAVTTEATIEGAVQLLVARFDTDTETLGRDLRELLEQLSARGLVELDSP